jgi:predicted metalloprotease with PDZ domain
LQPATTAPAFLALLFQVRGVIDLTSSQKGEYSAVGPEPRDGSLFTTALYKFLNQNRERQLTWPTVFAAVKDRAADQFKSQYPNGIENQFTQTAYAFQLKAAPVEPPPPPPLQGGGPGNTSRLGVLATEQPGGGVRVVEVWAGYPGTQSRVRETGERLNLEPGDVILAINGQAIRNLQDYVTLVKNSPPEIDLRVRDQRTGQQVNLRTTLRPASGTGPGTRRSRFGVLAVSNGDGQGVRITEVWDGYPGQSARLLATGESMRLEPGDVIVAINGQPLNSLQDYVNAVKGSPREMRFTVRDARTGNLLEMKATLRD